LARDFGIERNDADAERIAHRLAVRMSRPCWSKSLFSSGSKVLCASFSSLGRVPTVAVSRIGLPSRRMSSGILVARLHIGNDVGKCFVGRDIAAVDLEDDVAFLQAGLVSGLAGDNAGNEFASIFVNAQCVGESAPTG
jgi:hypothetical protein